MILPGHNEIEGRYTPLERARRQFVRELLLAFVGGYASGDGPDEDYAYVEALAELHYPEPEADDGHDG